MKKLIFTLAFIVISLLGNNLYADYFAPADSCETVSNYIGGCQLRCVEKLQGAYMLYDTISTPNETMQIFHKQPQNPNYKGRDSLIGLSAKTIGGCTFKCVGTGYAICEGTRPNRSPEVPALKVPASLGVSCDKAYDITYNGITIQACNLGAEVVGFGTGSYGSIFQWGNNYAFPNHAPEYYSPRSTSFPSSSTNGPGNYFSSDIFRLTPSGGTRTSNFNLRGGQGDTSSSNGVGTHANRQGPCSTGYHVPSILERQNMLNGANPYNSNDFYLPTPTFRRSSDSKILSGTNGNYRSSSRLTSDTASAYKMVFDTSSAYFDYDHRGNTTRGISIRCFKNSDGT